MYIMKFLSLTIPISFDTYFTTAEVPRNYYHTRISEQVQDWDAGCDRQATNISGKCRKLWIVKGDLSVYFGIIRWRNTDLSHKANRWVDMVLKIRTIVRWPNELLPILNWSSCAALKVMFLLLFVAVAISCWWRWWWRWWWLGKSSPFEWWWWWFITISWGNFK